MKVCALTARGQAAIGGIALYGCGAGHAISKVFQSGRAGGVVNFTPGGIYHGKLMDETKPVDEVIVGCEKEDFFAIHGHGNPILTEQMVGIFAKMGAQVETVEQMLAGQMPAQNAIETEANIEQLKAVTAEGVRIIQAQIRGGLSAMAKNWLEGFENAEKIRRQCSDIIRKSVIANRITRGVRIALAGPVNSGKSTLFNYYAGRTEAITADYAGTTRDWVSAAVRIGPLMAELADTAGLGEIANGDKTDAEAQRRTRQIIGDADLVLFVVDGSGDLSAAAEIKGDVPAILVLNKSDLGFEAGQVNGEFAATVSISAKTREGIEILNGEILKTLGAADFCPGSPVCFTIRQREIIERITQLHNTGEIKDAIRQLLYRSGSV